MWSMPSDRFFHLAERLTAYQGVMRMRAEEYSRHNPGARSAATGQTRATGAAQDQVTYYDDIAQAPELAQYFGPRRDQTKG